MCLDHHRTTLKAIYRIAANLGLGASYQLFEIVAHAKTIAVTNNAKATSTARFSGVGVTANDTTNSGNYTIAPRVGFIYNLESARRTQVRGGLGLFQGKSPAVWISNAYSNAGSVGSVVATNPAGATFNPNATTQTPPAGSPLDRLLQQGRAQNDRAAETLAHLPAAGEIVLFDRSWYNRAGVERVMGFCSDDELEEFFRSVPEFEKMLVRSGIRVIKYWFSISDEEQSARFIASVGAQSASTGDTHTDGSRLLAPTRNRAARSAACTAGSKCTLEKCV